MDNRNFIITLTGSSQSGKTLLMNKIQQLGIRLKKKIYSFYQRLLENIPLGISDGMKKNYFSKESIRM